MKFLKPLLEMAVLKMAVMAAAAAQTPAQKPSFEAASIKPNSSGSPTSAAFINGRFIATNAPLNVILGLAYRSSDGRPFYRIIGGPDWMASATYDVEAKTAESRPIPVDQASLMIQSLLEERFQLKVHIQTRELPVFHLVVAKSGAKLKMSQDQTPLSVEGTTQLSSPDSSGKLPRGRYEVTRSPSSSGGTLTAQGTALSASALANLIERYTDRPVRDKTGLTGLFDVELHFVRQTFTATRLPDGRPDAASPDTSALSIFTAIEEQLGLKLESSRGPVEVLVIDSVQKPSEN
jgi:uncharacterized protein (TIGR03435 family)